MLEFDVISSNYYQSLRFCERFEDFHLCANGKFYCPHPAGKTIKAMSNQSKLCPVIPNELFGYYISGHISLALISGIRHVYAQGLLCSFLQQALLNYLKWNGFYAQRYILFFPGVVCLASKWLFSEPPGVTSHTFTRNHLRGNFLMGNPQPL